MKNRIFILAIAAACIAATACDKDNGRLGANAMVSLRAAKGVRAEVVENPEHLSALEIVKLTNDMAFWCPRYYPDNTQGFYRGFADVQRDYANERLLMWGTDIIHDETGVIQNMFIGGEDIVLRRATDPVRGMVDTIAYIPNSTLRAAESAVREAYAKKDYTAVYKLFDTAFTFTPITGDEWRELKRQGLN